MTVDGEERFGVNILKRALEEPLRIIANNAGHEGSVVVQRVKNESDSVGFNAETEIYEDLMKAGIMDPTKVVRLALQNAGSVAGLLLTTDVLVAERPKEKRNEKVNDYPDDY
jgi:chaperonin GroEL